MAEKQTKKRASGGKTTGKSSGSRKCTSKSSRAKANARTPVRREVGAGICLVLALCTTLGCLGIQGALLSLLISLFRGLIGKGLYILPFSFVMGFLILLLHDGRPVALRVTCSMLLAVTIGALVQLVGGQEGADWSASMLADLWDGGLDGSCAGVVAGLLAQTLELIISRAGAVIVLLAALALELITSLNMTVRGIITAIKNRPRIEYDEPKLEHPDPAERIVNHVATRHIEHVQQEQERRRAKASEFDLPVDEPPLPEEPPMREEPGERVFDIPEDAIPVRPAQPKAVPAKSAASIPSAPKPQTAVHSAAPVSGDWWKALSENCKGQIPPMYRAFLDLCGGVLEGDQLTVFAPDEITLNRLDNDRVRGVLSAEAEKVSGQPVRLLLREGEPPKPSPEENLKQLLQFGSQFDNIEIK
mgnify:CR=1 FL=1